MKKILVAVMGLLCATALVVHAQDATANTAATKHSKKKLTPAQQELYKEMLAKYDTDKNGKLDKTERATITPEDKEKMTKAGLLKSKKKKSETSDTATNAAAH